MVETHTLGLALGEGSATAVDDSSRPIASVMGGVCCVSCVPKEPLVPEDPSVASLYEYSRDAEV